MAWTTTSWISKRNHEGLPGKSLSVAWLRDRLAFFLCRLQPGLFGNDHLADCFLGRRAERRAIFQIGNVGGNAYGVDHAVCEPRVAAARQPWAVGCNAFGVNA